MAETLTSDAATSDATGEVVDQAKCALARTAIYCFREIAVESDGAQIVLSGRVSTFYHKQMAQEAVRTIANDIRVCNRIDVTDEPYLD